MREKKILILITSLLCLVLWACGDEEKENNTSNGSLFDELKTMNQATDKEDETDKKNKYFSVVGLYQEEAEYMLEKEGFEVKIREEESNDAESGTVIEQYPSPKDDVEMKKGDTVIIIVSRGNKEAKNYSYDIQKLDSIKTAMSTLVAAWNSDYSMVNGKVGSLAGLMLNSTNKVILNEALKGIFDERGNFKSQSLVFEGIKTADVKIYVSRGAVSILVPVNEAYAKDFKCYKVGTYNWPEKMMVKKEGAIDVTLKVWCPAEDQDSGWIQMMCEKFNTAHPEWNITYVYETCGEGNAGREVGANVESAGDIYFFANDQLDDLINADAIATIGGEAANYVKGTNSKTMINTVSRDGSLYGIPFTANTWYMYYDKSVFSEEDVKSLDKMLEKGVVSFPITDTWYFASFYAAGGATFYGPNGDNEAAGVVLGNKATDVTNYLIDLIANKNFVNDESDSGIAGLRDKSVNAVFSGSWKYDAVKEILGDNMGIVQCPNMKIGTMKSFAGSKAVGVNPNCEYQEVAVALATYLAGEEAQKYHYEMRGIIPCNTTLLESEALKNNKLAQAQANTIANTSIIQPANDSFNANYWDNAKIFVTSIYDGTITKDNAAEKTKEFENCLNGR